MNKDRPNILLLFVDQQRSDTLHALGNPLIRTPHLDRLCREGTAFISAYTPSPVCVAARCSMLFGQYPFHTDCYENTRMPEGRETFVSALTRAGYRTHGIGKCHFSPDLHALRGFQSRETQEELVCTVEEDDYLKYLHESGYGYVCDPHGIRSEMYYIPQPSQLPERYHPSQWIGDRTCDWLRQPSRKKEPWFCFASFIHPHPPFTPPNPWHKLYRAPDMPLPRVPENSGSLLTYVNHVQNRYKFRDRGFDLNLARALKAYYYACISFVDFQVGRILAALEKSGQLNRTLILFTSDHGEHLGDYGCYGKRSMHDTAARIPLIARLPGVFKAGGRCAEPVSLVDVAPTVLGRAGAEIRGHSMDGIDLAEAPAGKGGPGTVFAQHAVLPHDSEEAVAARSSYMAVNGRYKYFYSAPDNREFLFDRTADPGETVNIAGAREHEAGKGELRRALLDALASAGKSAGIDGNGWRVFPPCRVSEDPDAGLIVQDHPWATVTLPGYDDNVKRDVPVFL